MTSNLKINLSITSPNEMLSDKNETLIIGIQENGNSQSSKNIFNKASKGLMNTLIKRKEFSGKVNTSCYIPALADQKDKKFFLLGLGNTSDKFKDDDASKLITKICTLAKTANTKKVSLFLPEIKFEKEIFLGSCKTFQCNWNHRLINIFLMEKKNKKIIFLRP